MTITLHADRIAQLDTSPKVQKGLTALLTSLIADLPGEPLRSASVYGSIARKEWHAKVSDVNLLLVLDRVDFRILDVMGPPMAQAQKSIRVTPFILTPAELDQASDVFCVKFNDIKQHHSCVAGDDLLDQLTVRPDELRFVCEFDLRNIALRMRMFFLRSYGSDRIELATLMRFFSSAMFPLRALLGLLGAPQPAATPAALDALGGALDTDITALHTLWDMHRKGATRAKHAEVMTLYSGLHAVVNAAVAKADALAPA